MAEITVQMKADSSEGGKRHTHNNASGYVHEGVLKVTYDRSRLIVCYPLTSIEKYEVRD